MNVKSVLLIDDDRDILVILSVSLRRELKYQVITASDGHKGLLLATTSQPDLIILDVLMPVFDGFATCKALKENSVTSRIPVIFLTGLDGEQQSHRALSVGGAAIVAKTGDPLTICKKIACIAETL